MLVDVLMASRKKVPKLHFYTSPRIQTSTSLRKTALKEDTNQSRQCPHAFVTTTILMASWVYSRSGQVVDSISEISRPSQVCLIALIISILHAFFPYRPLDTVLPSAKGVEPSLSQVTRSEQGHEGQQQSVS